MNLGDLEILNLHASGGMAEVFRARVVDEQGREQLLAVKKILPQFTRDKDILRMFIEEARVAACLDHPNVVRVYDLCAGDSAAPASSSSSSSSMGAQGKGSDYYIVMEFADGKDLSDIIWEAVQHRQRLPLGMTVQAARDVARALHHAYNAVDANGVQLKLIHRDVSPHNVLVTWDGRIKLTDFGIAKVQASANKTQMGVIKGKFGYMSPEQARARPLDQRSDLYNVGIMMFEAFTGERLFGGETDVETLEQMRAAKIPRLDPALMVPAPLEAFMRRVLDKDPNLRPADAVVFEAELMAAAEKSRIVPRPNETAHVIAQLFPQLAKQAASPVVKGPSKDTARLNLKSQLWGPDLAAAAKAAAAPRPGVAVQAAGRAAALPLPALSSSPPASSPSSPPPPPSLAPPSAPPAPPSLASPPQVADARRAPAAAPPAPRVAALPLDDPPRAMPAALPSSSSSSQRAGAAAPGSVSSLPGPLPPTTSSSSMPAVGRGAVVAGGKAAAVAVDDALPAAGRAAVRVGGGARSIDGASSSSPPLAERGAGDSATRVELNPLSGARGAAPGFAAPLPPTLPADPPPRASSAPPPRSPTVAGFDTAGAGGRPALAPLPPPPPPPALTPQGAAPSWGPPPPWASPPQPTPHAPATPQAPAWGAAPMLPAPVAHWGPAPLPLPPVLPPPSPPASSPAAWAPSWAPGPSHASPPAAASMAALPPQMLPPPPPQMLPPPPPYGPAPFAPPPAPTTSRHAPPPPSPSTLSGPPPSSPGAHDATSSADHADVDADEAFGAVEPASPPVSSSSSSSPPPMRKSHRQVAREVFVERWLPRGVRVGAVVMGVVGVVGGLAGGVLVQGALASRAASATRALVVRTTPGGATVALDGQRLDGVTPLAVDVALADGPHALTLTLAKSAVAAVERKIVVAADDRFVLVNETLQSAGRVVVDTRPAGARLLLDGRDVGRAPVTLDDVGTDKPHVVEARTPGFRTATATIPVDRGANHAVTLTLESTGTPGRLVILAAAPGDVVVDGVPWGPTSTSVDDERECAAGRHEVVVTMPSLGARAVMTIDVPERGVARVLAGL